MDFFSPIDGVYSSTIYRIVGIFPQPSVRYPLLTTYAFLHIDAFPAYVRVRNDYTLPRIEGSFFLFLGDLSPLFYRLTNKSS